MNLNAPIHLSHINIETQVYGHLITRNLARPSYIQEYKTIYHISTYPAVLYALIFVSHVIRVPSSPPKIRT